MIFKQTNIPVLVSKACTALLNAAEPKKSMTCHAATSQPANLSDASDVHNAMLNCEHRSNIEDFATGLMCSALFIYGLNHSLRVTHCQHLNLLLYSV